MRDKRVRRRRITLAVVALWALAMVVPALLMPTPADAKVGGETWMVYAPNHPNYCVPLPYDCYVILVVPD